jgi:hypothetical protein
MGQCAKTREAGEATGGCGLQAAVALLCVLLVVFAGLVQVGHSHIGRAGIHADCSLCVAAHVTLQAAENPVPAPAAAVAAATERTVVLPGARSHSSFALFTRPPPAAAAVAA